MHQSGQRGFRTNTTMSPVVSFFGVELPSNSTVFLELYLSLEQRLAAWEDNFLFAVPHRLYFGMLISPARVFLHTLVSH